MLANSFYALVKSELAKAQNGMVGYENRVQELWYPITDTCSSVVLYLLGALLEKEPFSDESGSFFAFSRREILSNISNVNYTDARQKNGRKTFKVLFPL